MRIRIKKLPTSVRPDASDAPRREVIHHFVGSNFMVKDLYVLTDEWMPLDSPSSWANINVVELATFSFLEPRNKHLVCLLSEKPVTLYWPTADTILVLDSNREDWEPERKEIRWGNYRIHI